MEQILERIRNLFPEPEALPEPDAKLAFYLLGLGEAYRGQGKNWNDAMACFERAMSIMILWHHYGSPRGISHGMVILLNKHFTKCT